MWEVERLQGPKGGALVICMLEVARPCHASYVFGKQGRERGGGWGGGRETALSV